MRAGRPRDTGQLSVGGSGRCGVGVPVAVDGCPLAAMASILDEYEDSLYRSASVQQSRASVGIPHSGRCAAAPTQPSAHAVPGGSAALRLQPGPGHVVSPPSAQGRSRPGVRPSGGLLPPVVPLRGLQCAGSPATGFPAGKGRQGGSSLAGGGLRSGGCQAEGNASSKKVYHRVCGVTFRCDLFCHHLLCEMF